VCGLEAMQKRRRGVEREHELGTGVGRRRGRRGHNPPFLDTAQHKYVLHSLHYVHFRDRYGDNTFV